MKILLTGGTGNLGKEIRKYLKVYAPSHKKLDITKSETMKGNYDMVIHCAAYTDVLKAETNKEECYRVNVLGTSRLLEAYPRAKFVFISSEYVYKPVNFYAKTKVMAEELVSRHRDHNYLIIRTLFKKRPYPYDVTLFDQYTQGDYVDVIAPMIVTAILDRKMGVIDVGTGRKSMFELARQTKPNIRAISVHDIKGVKLPPDYI